MIQDPYIKPLSYLNNNPNTDVVTLDCQYSHNGNHLAISFSNGSISIYNTSKQSTIQQSPPSQNNKNPIMAFNSKQISKYLFIKLAWSFIDPTILVAVSVSKDIVCFKVNNDGMHIVKKIQTNFIPIYPCYYPGFKDNLLSVGFAGGKIQIYNENLDVLESVDAHKQAVNWLSWQNKFQNSQRNMWVIQHYPQYSNKQQRKIKPLLLSGSSDRSIKIWKINDNKNLIELYCLVEHLREIRQVMWKPNYLYNTQNCKIFVSCSEDGYVKFWEVTKNRNNKIVVNQKGIRKFDGAVYRAEYNHQGTLIAISYHFSQEEKIKTKVFMDNKGTLGKEVSISNQGS